MFAIDHGAPGTVVIKGRLDAAQSPTAQAFLDGVEGTVTLDCSGLEYISSAGLGVLLKTQKRLLASGGKLRLSGVSRHLQDIFGYSGFDQLFEIDLALVERFRKGDREAFTELVIRYQRPIYNAAFWILRRPEDASDVAQTVFLRIAERLDEYDEQYKFFSWVYRIAVNESLNVLRRYGREEPLDEEIDFPASDSA